MKSTLEEVLAYRNDAVVYRFMETWDLPFEEAMDLFRDTLRWIWLCVRASTGTDSPVRFRITRATMLLDEMWHAFILFTRDYHAFCERYFGLYVHHVPTSKGELDAQIAQHQRDPEALLEERRAWLTEQCETVYDVLGEEIAIRWYSEYLDRYNDAFLRSVWRWSFSPHDPRVRESVHLTWRDSRLPV